MSRESNKTSHLGVINRIGRPPVKPPGLLRVIQKNSISHYEQLLAHLFSATDDLFYDLSKRASSNQEQNLYFEAMREIRIKREGIANQFLRTLAEAFSLLIEQPESSGFDDELADETETTLSIVKGDDLEVELAVSNMVSRTRDSYRSELYELELRLDHLLLQLEISENNNPLNPLIISKAFVESCQTCLKTGIKAKLILFKLFEKHVLKQLGHIYADANQILLDAGILPKIPSSLRANGSKEQGATSKDGGDTSDSSPGRPHDQRASDQSAFNSTIQNFSMQQGALGLLLEAARSISSSVATQFSGSAQATDFGRQGGGSYQTPHYFLGASTRSDTNQPFNCYIYSSNPGPVMRKLELTQQLTQTQQHMDQHLASSVAPQNLVSDVVQEVLAKSDPKKPQALEKTDEHVINLVSMFFDQILADESLHVVVQALICRLQIPIVKVALRDSTFFSHSAHPARKLINTITLLGIGFDENKPIERDPVYRKIADVVKSLNKNYTSDDAIFTALQADLDNFVARERRKAHIVEQRTTQTEEGKSRIKQARKSTQDLIYQKLKDLELPEEIKAFLVTHWLQVMVVTNLKKGINSKEWAANEQTITDLIWVSGAHADARSIQRRERMMPELLDRLEIELEVVLTNPAARRDCVQLLEQALVDVDQPAVSAPKTSSLNEEQKEALGKGEDAPKQWSEMTAVEKQKVRYEELSANYFGMAKDLAVGAWVEYLSEDTGKPIRCKLASKLDVDAYLFTNRMGFKVLEKSRKQFAYDMQFFKVKVLDDRPLFDRIMDKVVGNLSSSKD